ncbi:uncharacterized protein LOC143430481 [Xylocopa sonorina]|uniref:uncharacterized protein LOC143430481 n=1 Tax=Xylocopa sonorina TaxID=1818115 RepID=UPI00403A93A2
MAHRIFITDQDTRVRLLVETDADLCVFPRSRIQGKPLQADYSLHAANGTLIATYDAIALKLNFSLRREIVWRFVVADVETPIIGIDFVTYYNLLVDPRNRRLIDKTTNLFTCDAAVRSSAGSLNSQTSPGHLFLTPRRSGIRFSTISRQPQSRLSSANLVEGRNRPDAPSRRNPTFEEPLGITITPGSKERRERDTSLWGLPGLEHAYSARQISVTPGDTEKTAIAILFRLFEFIFMPFCLRNAGQTCQRFVDQITRGLDFVFAYIDDFLIASENEAEHREYLRILFSRLSEHGIAFNDIKKGLAEASMLAHPIPSAPINMVDASDYTVRAVLQQFAKDSWQPLASFTKALSAAQRKYSACDLYTDHKPLTFAFKQNLEKCSPRQFRYLDFISQFTTEIRHINTFVVQCDSTEFLPRPKFNCRGAKT